MHVDVVNSVVLNRPVGDVAPVCSRTGQCAPVVREHQVGRMEDAASGFSAWFAPVMALMVEGQTERISRCASSVFEEKVS
jgi:hypothetical protein